MLNSMSVETLYQALGSPVVAGVAPERTEVTFVETETIDRDKATEGRDTRLLHPVEQQSHDPGRTEHTATVETIDRDRHAAGCSSQLINGSLFEAISTRAQTSERGRTEVTKAGDETIDRDHHAFAFHYQLTGDGDLYRALSHPAASANGDRGRTAITEATETIDWDKPAGALGA